MSDEKKQVHAVRTSELWHVFGHPLKEVLCLLAKDLDIKDSLENKMQKPCDACLRAKQTHCLFSQSESHASDLFELIHRDIWGAYRESSSCDAHYFLTIIDDKSRTVWIYLMRDKGETSKLVQNFVIFVENSIR